MAWIHGEATDFYAVNITEQQHGFSTYLIRWLFFYRPAVHTQQREAMSEVRRRVH